MFKLVCRGCVYLTRLFHILQYHYSVFLFTITWFIYEANDLLLLCISLPAKVLDPFTCQNHILQKLWFFFSSCLSLWDEPRWQVADQKLSGMRQVKNMKETDLCFLLSLYFAFNFILKHWICVYGLFGFFKKLFFLILLTSQDSLLLSVIFSPSDICMSCARNKKKRGKETWSFQR